MSKMKRFYLFNFKDVSRSEREQQPVSPADKSHAKSAENGSFFVLSFIFFFFFFFSTRCENVLLGERRTPALKCRFNISRMPFCLIDLEMAQMYC